jgi:hypothetical protein
MVKVFLKNLRFKIYHKYIWHTYHSLNYWKSNGYYHRVTLRLIPFGFWLRKFYDGTHNGEKIIDIYKYDTLCPKEK